MSPSLLYRSVAFGHVVCGVVLSFGIVVGVVGIFLSEKKDSLLLGGILLGVLAVIAGSLIQSALAHLKNPSRKTSLALAANSSVIIWAFVGGLLASGGAKEIGHAIGLALAYLIYRFFLKPAAIHAFPA